MGFVDKLTVFLRMLTLQPLVIVEFVLHGPSMQCSCSAVLRTKLAEPVQTGRRISLLIDKKTIPCSNRR